MLRRPGVTAPIVGATKLGHLQDALAAEALVLSDEDMTRLEEPYVPHPVLGPLLSAAPVDRAPGVRRPGSLSGVSRQASKSTGTEVGERKIRPRM